MTKCIKLSKHGRILFLQVGSNKKIQNSNKKKNIFIKKNWDFCGIIHTRYSI